MQTYQTIKGYLKSIFNPQPTPVLYVEGALPEIIEKFPKLGIHLVRRKSNLNPGDTTIGFMKMTDDIATGKMLCNELIYDNETLQRFTALNTCDGEIPTLAITLYDVSGVYHKMRAKISTMGKEYDFLTDSSFFKEKFSKAPAFRKIMYVERLDMPMEQMQRTAASFEEPVTYPYRGIVLRGIDNLEYMLGKYGTGPFIVSRYYDEVSFYLLDGKHLFSVSRVADDDFD